MANLNLGGRSENSVAQGAGIALSTLRRRIADPASLTMAELLRLSEFMECSPADLLRDTFPGVGFEHREAC